MFSKNGQLSAGSHKNHAKLKIHYTSSITDFDELSHDFCHMTLCLSNVARFCYRGIINGRRNSHIVACSNLRFISNKTTSYMS